MRVHSTDQIEVEVAVGPVEAAEISTLVTPYTLLRWYRRPIAQKYDGSKSRTAGRPKTAAEIGQPIVRMPRSNPTWGYTRIRGALSNLGHEIGRNTIKRILLDNGINPAVCHQISSAATDEHRVRRFWYLRRCLPGIAMVKPADARESHYFGVNSPQHLLVKSSG